MSVTEAQTDVGQITYGPCTASVEWKIENYFQLPQELDYPFESHPFKFLEATWILRLYPNGQSKEQSENFISVYLVRKQSIHLNHRLHFRFRISERNGTKVSDLKSIHTFKKREETRGFLWYLKVTELIQNREEIAPDGVLTIMCTLKANACKSVHAAVQTEVPLGIEKLVHDFTNLMLSEDATDFTLIVQKREFKVHRAVLAARSEVFSAMMKHNMKEKNSGIVTIDDCDPDAFQQFLTYLYTGNMDNFSDDAMFALHNIAHKYDTQELRMYCLEYATNNLSVDTFCDVLSLSLKYNVSDLREKAIAFFSKNLMDILVSVKWLTFIKENPVESNELYIKVAKCYATCQCNASSCKEK